MSENKEQELNAEDAPTLSDLHRVIMSEESNLAYCECSQGEVTLDDAGNYECSKYRLAKFIVSG